MNLFGLLGRTDPVAPHSTPAWIDRGRRIGVALRYLLYRNDIRGLENVPQAGAVLFVANHTNFIDGPVLFGLLPRRVSFLIKSEAMTGPLGWLLAKVGQFSINRAEVDRRPLLAALELLKSGGCVGIFPEGTRGDGKVSQVFGGAGWLAGRSGATVVPIAVRGTARPGRRRRFRPTVTVLFGTPFAVPSGVGRTAVANATYTIQRHLADLVDTLDATLAQQENGSQR